VERFEDFVPRKELYKKQIDVTKGCCLYSSINETVKNSWNSTVLKTWMLGDNQKAYPKLEVLMI